MKYIIAIDSDGTLRKNDGSISKANKNAINAQVAMGNIVIICSARPRYHTARISEEVGLNDYLISSNGSEIFDVKNKRVLWAEYLKDENCKILYKYARKNDIRIMFVLENTEYVTKFTRNNSQILLTDEIFNDVLCGKVKQAMVIGEEKEKINKFKNEVKEKYGMNISDSSATGKKEVWFSVTSDDVSKGKALLKLAGYLNIPSDNIVSIGNDNNDISMFKISGISVAVGNATRRALNAAQYITKTNDEDGVATFLKKL